MMIHDFRSAGVDSMSDTEESILRKRAREEAEEKKKNRGNYNCSKCNLPKKGHICPYQPRYRRRDAVLQEGAANNVEVQCEMDPEMTVRTLRLEVQGLLESYVTTAPRPSLSTLLSPSITH